ncbi:MAG: DUF1883 domain-containing protein [Flavobacteriales bacterium]|nr:DUF1883 domain-containing protein [Flavobacteriales bacterium]
MKFQHRKYPAKRGEVIEVGLHGQAMVKFMTAKEFKNYAGGRTHTYYKGRPEGDSVRFVLPFDGIWHAVVEKAKDQVAATCKLRAPNPELARAVLQEADAEGTGEA